MKPEYVAEAEEYLKGCICRPTAPEFVAAAVRVSSRRLFAGFKTYLNTTPMRYLRDLRLDRVREALTNAASHRTLITDVAMDCGFRHLGRFDAAYKERFGEQPRETLRKRQRQTRCSVVGNATESTDGRGKG